MSVTFLEKSNNISGHLMAMRQVESSQEIIDGLAYAIVSIFNEIKQVNKGKKRNKSVVDHYEFVKEINGKLIYKLWIADQIKIREEENVTIKSSNHTIDATVISSHDVSCYTVQVAQKLVDDIYYLIKVFNPTFILEALAKVLSGINLQVDRVLDVIVGKLIYNQTINIDDKSSFLYNLNISQKNAVLLTESKEVSLIWGPPGTGKTHTLSQIIYRAFRRNEKILVLSTSNVAIDQVILHLDKFLFTAEKAAVLRLGHTDNDVCAQYTKEIISTITEKIVFSTLATAALKYEKLSEVKFDVVVVDESSMVSMPYVFLAASLCSRNIVCAGDFRQLPPIALADDTLLAVNIFEYLGVDVIVRKKSRQPPYLALLDIQYRMGPDISQFVSKFFYNNLLKCGANYIKNNKLEFINIDTECSLHDSYYSVEYGSYYNPISIFIVDKIAEAHSGRNILYISPYRAQQNIINYYLLDKQYSDSKSLTVHKAQGSESDIVIFDLTTHSSGSGSEYSKMFTSKYTENLINVAISRTRKHLIVIGSLSMLHKMSRMSTFWGNFYFNIINGFSSKDAFGMVFKKSHIGIKLSDEKVIVCVDKKNNKEILDLFKKSKAEKKIYFSNTDHPVQSGITFRKLSRTNMPEMIIWGDEIVLSDRHLSCSLSLTMTSQVLRRVVVGHLVDMAEPSRENSYILHCEHCGHNKILTYDESRFSYVLMCTDCQRTTFVTEKIANDLKSIYKIKCPEPNCGADMIPRKKRGQRSFSFFGCTNYPSCTGLVSFKEIAS